MEFADFNHPGLENQPQLLTQNN